MATMDPSYMCAQSVNHPWRWSWWNPGSIHVVSRHNPVRARDKPVSDTHRMRIRARQPVSFLATGGRLMRLQPQQREDSTDTATDSATDRYSARGGVSKIANGHLRTRW